MRSIPYKLPLILLAGLLLSSCTYRFYSPGCELPAPGNLVKHCILDSSVHETSGLIYLDGNIWTFNDSGGEASLYCINPENGELIKKLSVEGAGNTDWEDICMDSSHVFIGDVGNNFASRDTLDIYRIPLDALRGNSREVRTDGIIRLSYKEEVRMNSSGFPSLDCEALLCWGDSLYLYTKNWVDQSSSVYILPKTPGHYHLQARRTYPARMLVTGADLSPMDKKVALVGYRDYMPVLIIYGFDQSPDRISCGGKGRIYPLRLGRQTEGICYDRRGLLFISSEKSLKKQSLFRMGAALR